jgi:hypothetical protein
VSSIGQHGISRVDHIGEQLPCTLWIHGIPNDDRIYVSVRRVEYTTRRIEVA